MLPSVVIRCCRSMTVSTPYSHQFRIRPGRRCTVACNVMVSAACLRSKATSPRRRSNAIRSGTFTLVLGLDPRHPVHQSQTGPVGALFEGGIVDGFIVHGNRRSVTGSFMRGQACIAGTRVRRRRLRLIPARSASARRRRPAAPSARAAAAPLSAVPSPRAAPEPRYSRWRRQPSGR